MPTGISEEDVSQNNPYFYLWIVSAVISTCYTFTWDIKMDWGLMDLKNAGENKFLREEIVYAYKVRKTDFLFMMIKSGLQNYEIGF